MRDFPKIGRRPSSPDPFSRLISTHLPADCPKRDGAGPEAVDAANQWAYDPGQGVAPDGPRQWH